jgi:hypothetical protein
MSILGAIANPQMADIAGAIDYREKKIAADEAKRKEIRINEIAGKALASGLREGSVLHELAMNDPKTYVFVSKASGFDPANGAEGTAFTDDIESIYKHSQSSVEDGLGYVNTLIQSRDKLGLDTSRLQKLYQGGIDNPTIFKNSIKALHETLNPMKESDKLNRDQFEWEKTHGKQLTAGQAEQKRQFDIVHGADDGAIDQGFDNALTDMANRIIDGEDKSKVIGNFGRGQQGARDLRALEIRTAQLRRERGVSTEQSRSNQQDVAGAAKAVKDFDTGKHGNSVRSFNVSLSHLDTLQKAGDALDNGDIPLFNKLSNAIGAQTGSVAPTNFDGVKNIVSDEIVKAIIGSGGGVHDREIAAKKLDSAKSPAQLKGVIADYKDLMAGQLKGLETQYKASTKRDDFHTYLSDESKSYLGYGKSDKSMQEGQPNGQTIEQKKARLEALRANQKF